MIFQALELLTIFFDGELIVLIGNHMRMLNELHKLATPSMG